MRRTAIALLITGLALAGCSSTNAAPSPSSPAQRLADLDDGSHTVSQYQKALDTWGTRCTESTTTLAGYVYATVEDLRKNGINDESEYSALTHLRDSTPAGVKTKCEDVAAGYLALREGGKQ
ncbi:hypothetical protein SAMN04490357_1023 [Streptomyces misionensis]|uniref:Lipoprotein n=1 Tax=Streptomyces misionensis TaxID=67331 RepID=A0A1H4P999_9ACTN|nr:hypothetical protein [Streptomyces misionensis]SEC03804.1 hypothetical protein SAMN04490357_1023 [Streptomyces misionensis]